MNRAFAAVVLLLGVPLVVAACIWDRDTPAQEAKGLPEVVAVLTGRFPRNPPLYYEMRLKRVSEYLERYPEDLASYDDVAVACDRLGKGDDAIAWMGQKRAQLEKLDATDPTIKDHWYRYHANLGTFLVHRWFRQGADRSKLDDVQRGRDEIAKAIEINPDAHFGREKYQLKVMDWIIEEPLHDDPYHLENFLGWGYEQFGERKINPNEAEAAVRGLSGLIVLGNAWESIDVYNALEVALFNHTAGHESRQELGRSTLAYLAYLRCVELVRSGKSSIRQNAPKGPDLEQRLTRIAYVSAKAVLDKEYPLLRAEADRWQEARTKFMNARLEQGLHPDVNPNFWDGYVEAPAPLLPDTIEDPSQSRRRYSRFFAWFAAGGAFAAAALIAGAAGLLIKKRKRNAATA